jgi:hypothetical protein
MSKKNWIEVKDEIEKEIDKIWYDEPIEVTLSKNGIYPSGAGSQERYFGNLFFQVSDPMCLGWSLVEPAMYKAIADENFTLQALKNMFQYLVHGKVRLLGGTYGENCPAAWLNLPKFWSFYNDIVDSFDTIDNKDDFKDLIWSWQNYVSRMCRWFHTVYPWEATGALMHRKEGIKDGEEYLNLTKKAVEYMTPKKGE